MAQQRMQQRLFEDLLDSDVKAHKTKQGYTLPVSIAIHVVVLLAVVIVPLMTAETLPEPTSVVKAFFVEPASAPPPPPPPPPPAPKAQVQPRAVSTPQPVTENKFTAPIETPDEVRPEEGIDLGVEGGVPGGVEGGAIFHDSGVEQNEAIDGAVGEVARHAAHRIEVFQVAVPLARPHRLAFGVDRGVAMMVTQVDKGLAVGRFRKTGRGRGRLAPSATAARRASRR